MSLIRRHKDMVQAHSLGVAMQADMSEMKRDRCLGELHPPKKPENTRGIVLRMQRP